jgi:RimJ/RimL family protein N-acetyltransferase
MSDHDDHAVGAESRVSSRSAVDLPALLTAHRDPALRRRPATSSTNETDARQWLNARTAGWASTTRFSFAVVADEDSGPPIGYIVVEVGTASVAEVGYWTTAAVRGQGIAARALATSSRWYWARRTSSG